MQLAPVRKPRPLLPLFFLTTLLAVGAPPPSSPPAVLTTCAAVRALSRKEASLRLPVVARGVVTLLPLPQWSFTLDDGTGVWVELHGPNGEPDRPAELRIGDVVEVRGVSHEGLFAPLIAASAVRIVGRGDLPPARPIETVGLNSSRYGSQRVRIEGIVQSAETFAMEGHDEFRLSVATAMGHFEYVLLAPSPFPAGTLVDADVVLTGVALCEHNNRRQFTGLRIWSNDPADISIKQSAAGSPLDAPEVDLRDVMVFSPHGANLHRRRVQGVVSLCRPGRYFYIQSHGEALRINTAQPVALRPGDVVEAAGFFQMDNFRAEMTHAVVRVVGHQPPPQPIRIIPRDAFSVRHGSAYDLPQDYDDRLVVLRGRLVGIEHMANSPPVLNLEADGHFFVGAFSLHHPGNMDDLRLGSLLDVTGILAITYANPPDALDWQRPTALRVLLRDAADIQVVKPAPWWTPRRLQAALGVVVVILILAMAWSILLRRRVAQRGAELARAIRSKRDAEIEFESTLRERNRLAADLHDTMEQALTGLALQLETSEALRTQSPDASSRHMGLARQLLARSREDLRRSIWNLRSSLLDQKTLRQALREIAANRSVGQDVRIEVLSTGPERLLPESVAGNLLLLAQEGITNALKHAQAHLIQIRLAFSPKSLALEIRDDGRGFDPTLAVGAREGHFGLQGMRERIKRLGGTLRLESTPGSGTCLSVVVPLENVPVGAAATESDDRGTEPVPDPDGSDRGATT